MLLKCSQISSVSYFIQFLSENLVLFYREMDMVTKHIRIFWSWQSEFPDVVDVFSNNLYDVVVFIHCLLWFLLLRLSLVFYTLSCNSGRLFVYGWFCW